MTVAIPTGLQIFCWLATMWDGRPRFQVPMLYVVGFIVTFVIGGLSGVIIAAVPLDLQLHDTYFIVAHFHYVLIGGAVFPLLGILTYWFPKITGRMMSETLGKIGFWMLFLGFQLDLLPDALRGPARACRGASTPIPPASASSCPTSCRRSARSSSPRRSLLFVVNGLVSLYRGAIAAAQSVGRVEPRMGDRSPPPPYNFAHIPVVESRTPLWDADGELPVVTGLRVDEKEILLTTVVAAAPDLREPVPPPSLWPLIAAIAVGVLFVSSIFSPWAVVFGAIPVRHRARRLVLAEGAQAPSRAGDRMILEPRFTDDVAEPADPQVRAEQPDLVGHHRLHGHRGRFLRARLRRLFLPDGA